MRADERVALGVRKTVVAADRGAGLLVRADLRGVGIFVGAGEARDEGGLLLWDVGAGDDSFRRLLGGLLDVGDGVGSERTADGGFETTTEVGPATTAVVLTPLKVLSVGLTPLATLTPVATTAGCVGVAFVVAAALPDLL